MTMLIGLSLVVLLLGATGLEAGHIIYGNPLDVPAILKLPSGLLFVGGLLGVLAWGFASMREALNQ